MTRTATLTSRTKIYITRGKVGEVVSASDSGASYHVWLEGDNKISRCIRKRSIVKFDSRIHEEPDTPFREAVRDGDITRYLDKVIEKMVEFGIEDSSPEIFNYITSGCQLKRSQVRLESLRSSVERGVTRENRVEDPEIQVEDPDRSVSGDRTESS